MMKGLTTTSTCPKTCAGARHWGVLQCPAGGREIGSRTRFAAAVVYENKGFNRTSTLPVAMEKTGQFRNIDLFGDFLRDLIGPLPVFAPVPSTTGTPDTRRQDNQRTAENRPEQSKEPCLYQANAAW